jgi:hypothetical protein
MEVCSDRMQHNFTRKTRKETHLGSPRATWILTWSRNASVPMSKFYISSTASENIVDTLEFFPENYQMPQLSSTGLLLMAAKDMMDALQNPHPKVPLASVGDDTISALDDLVEILKLKRQTISPTTIHTQDIPNVPLTPRVVTPRTPAPNLRGCLLAHRDSIPTTCRNTSSAEWTQPAWSSLSEKTIGIGSTKQTLSYATPPERKWNTQHS